MQRLDLYLFENGLAQSRSLAAKLVRAGLVRVEGKVIKKPSYPVSPEDRVDVEKGDLTKYVSRGGLKLEAALSAFQISPSGLQCADIGASTGGFTDCLLQNGAAKVYAVDSGSSQLHESLRGREEVISMENTNARFLDEGSFGKVDLVVMDVSFISQRLLYPAVAKILKQGGAFISLIKPQFEVGRENVGSGGVVRNEKARLACIEALLLAAKKYGLEMKATIPSPITGGDGNTEYLALFQFAEKGKGE